CWSGASSAASGEPDAGCLAPPSALDDRDPATVWTEGGSAHGRGEWLTARTATPATPITGLRLLPGDTRNERTFRASRRPRALTLLLGLNPEQRFDVDLIEDADGGVAHYRRPFWIALPHPVPSSCVTVVIRDAGG